MIKLKSKILLLFFAIVGIILFIVGCVYKVPSKKLTTYSIFDDKTIIEEYVGGDAYNYIIGAALTGGEISGAIIAKSIYISFGILIEALIVVSFLLLSKNNLASAQNTCDVAKTDNKFYDKDG